MSLAVFSDLNTSQPFIALVKDGNQGKVAGVPLHFSAFGPSSAPGTMTYAIAQEQTNSTTSLIWVDGTAITNGTEVGVTRLWNRTALHARTLKIGAGFQYTQAADTNQVLVGVGQPGAGTGTNGDLSYDQPAGVVYLKTAGLWASLATIGSPQLKTINGQAIFGTGDLTVAAPMPDPSAPVTVLNPKLPDMVLVGNDWHSTAGDGSPSFSTAGNIVGTMVGEGWLSAVAQDALSSGAINFGPAGIYLDNNGTRLSFTGNGTGNITIALGTAYRCRRTAINTIVAETQPGSTGTWGVVYTFPGTATGTLTIGIGASYYGSNYLRSPRQVGIIGTTPFTQALPFTGSVDMGVVSVASVGAIVFTPNTTGAVTNGGGVVTLVADGVNAPSFGGGLKAFSTAAASYININGVSNDMAWNKTPSSYVYALSQPGYVPATPLAISSAQVSNVSPSVLQVTFARNVDPGYIPPASAFAVASHASTGTVTVAGAVVSVPLSTPFVNGETARTFVYTAPTSNGIRDTDGVLAPTSSAVAITNNVQPPVGQISYAAIATGSTIDLSSPVQKDWMVEPHRIGVQKRAVSLGGLFTRVVSGATLDGSYTGNLRNDGNTYYWSDGSPQATRNSGNPGYELDGTDKRYVWDNANPMKVGMSVNLVDQAAHTMRIGMATDTSGATVSGTLIVTISDNPTPIYIPVSQSGYVGIQTSVTVTAQAVTNNATLTVVLAANGSYTDGAGISHAYGTATVMAPYMVSFV